MAARVDRSYFHFLLTVAGGITCVAAVAIGLIIWWLHSNAIAEAFKDSSNLATVLAEQTENSIQAIELVLTEIRGHEEQRSLQAPDDIDRILRGDETYRFLMERRSRLPQAEYFSLLDKNGKLVNSTQQRPAPEIDLSDRAYFLYLKSNDDKSIYVSDSVINRVSGIQVVTFSKRITGANNTFLGVVLIGVKLTYFRHIYESIESVSDQLFTLLNRDGTIIVRFPDQVVRAGEQIPAASPWYRLVSQGGGTYRAPGFFDGESRLMAVRPLRNYPLVVNVGASEAAALATWRVQAIVLGTGALFVMLCVAYLLKAQSKQFLCLATSEATVEAALNNMLQGLVMFDSSGRMLISNKRYLELYGLSPDSVRLGCSLRDLLNLRIAAGTFRPDEIERTIADLEAAALRGTVFSRMAHLPDGRTISIVNHPMEGGGWVTTHEDVTEKKRAEERISQEIYVDELTNLPNRKAFYQELEDELKNVGREKRLAILYLDVDHLKRINDTRGHLVGDALLKIVADRLSACVRDIGWVARLSGDEFAVVQSMFDEPDDAAALAMRIIDAIREPFDLDDQKMSVSISVGIAIAPSDATERDELLKVADIALYEAKNRGRGTYCFYNSQLQESMQNRALLERDLQKALINGEFELYYQPVTSLADNKINSFEALLRWNHPSRGIVSPIEFIPIAEETGLIVPLGEWVLRTACAEAAKWPDDIQVAVNISAIQLAKKNLADVIVGAVAAAGIPPSKLELELTESVLITNTSANRATLKHLHEFGVQFAVDDFGTGYSSLGYLLSFPFHRIKIDRSFIVGLADNEESRAIVRAVSDLAKNLNMRLTAEGVETEQQLYQVRQLGCTEIQGYLLSRPRPAAEISQLLPQGNELVGGPRAVGGATPQNIRKMCRVRPDLVCSGGLTEHECDVLGGIVAGESCEESAVKLNLSPQLIEARRANIIKKHGVETSTGVVQIILTRGCEPLPSRHASSFLQISKAKVAS